MTFKLADSALELVQLGAIMIVGYLSVRVFDRVYSVIKGGSERLGQVPPERHALLYPFKKNTAFCDPIKRAALGSAAIVSVIRVVGRLIYDVMLGAPTDIFDVLWMVLYYSVDLLIGVCGYFVVLYIITYLTRFTYRHEQ